MEILVTGINHKSAGIELRERFSLAGDDLTTGLRRLAKREGVSELMILSTCNRVEVYAASAAPQAARRSIVSFLAGTGGMDPAEVERYIYEMSGIDAVRHIFRVAASLDSMVQGEAQILGQAKEAFREACAAGYCGPLLNRVMSRAFSVAKLVRTKTALGEARVSVGSVAVDLAMKIFGALDRSAVLVVGAGEVGQLVARHLKARGVSRFAVCNRSAEAAERVAVEFGASVRPFDDLVAAVEDAEIVLCSTASPGFILGRENVALVMKRRKQRPVFFIDLSVPRNIEPSVGTLPNVFLYNTDDMQAVVNANLKERTEEAKAASGIVEEEAAEFMAWVRAQGVVPVIKALREKFLSVAQEEIARTKPRLSGLDEDGERLLGVMFDAYVGKLLHDPITKLKEESASDGGSGLGEAVVELFKLEIVPEPVVAEQQAGAGQENVDYEKSGEDRHEGQ